MAIFSMRVQVITRSKGRSVIAAAAYRSGERLRDERQDMVHDYTHRTDVERTMILLPDNAPDWVRGIDRETLWNRIDAAEKRKDSQTAREMRVMIPRQLSPEERVRVVHDFVTQAFTSRGMIADVCFHASPASDQGINYHAHIMLSMRPLTEEGFGKKSRHDWVPDPTGLTHPDGRPVMIESDSLSWNSAIYYEQTCRAGWEHAANDALERAGSTARIDRRSYLERGIARLPEPALRLAYHLKELRGVMKERFGQWQYARFYRAVEEKAKTAIDRLGAGSSLTGEAIRTVQKFHQWFDRQIDNLGGEREVPRDPPDLSSGLER